MWRQTRMLDKSATKRPRDMDDDKAIIRRFIERVYSKGELIHVNDLVASDCIGYSTATADPYLGPEGIKIHVKQLRRAFHGFTMEIDDLHREGDTFEVSWTARGTHERRFLGLDPTCNIGQPGEEPKGYQLAISGVTTGTIKSGKIHQSTMVWDGEELRRQLGLSGENDEPDIGPSELTSRKSSLLEQQVR